MRGCDRGPGGPRHRLSRPRRNPQHTAKAGDGPRTGHRRLAGGRHSSRGERGGRARGCNRGPGGPRLRLGRPRRDPKHAANAGDRPRTGHERLAGGRHSSRGERRGRARGCDRVPGGRATPSAGHAATPGTPRKRGRNPVRAMGASPAAAAAAAVGRESAKYRAHANPTHTHTSPPKQFPPEFFPPGRARHVRPLAPERSPPGVTLPQLQRRQDARRLVQDGGEGAQAELRASHGSAERGAGGDKGRCPGARARGRPGHARQGARAQQRGGGRAQAADGATQRRGPGRDQGTGRGRRGAGREPRCRGRGEGRWANGRARAWGTGGGTRGTGRGLERGPRARARAPRAPMDGRDEAWVPRGGGRPERGGRGAGSPRSRTCGR